MTSTLWTSMGAFPAMGLGSLVLAMMSMLLPGAAVAPMVKAAGRRSRQRLRGRPDPAPDRSRDPNPDQLAADISWPPLTESATIARINIGCPDMKCPDIKYPDSDSMEIEGLNIECMDFGVSTEQKLAGRGRREG